jgi:addiction module RelE/StbE family toxin
VRAFSRTNQFKKDVKRAAKRGQDMAKLKTALELLIDGEPLPAKFKEEWSLTHDWEPVLHDPDDEPLVQLAQESGARVIITHNTRHLRPAVALGIQVLKPINFLFILRQSK